MSTGGNASNRTPLRASCAARPAPLQRPAGPGASLARSPASERRRAEPLRKVRSTWGGMACAAAGATAATSQAPTATGAHATNPPARQQPGLLKRHGPRACAREGLRSLGAAQRPARLPALGRLRGRGQARLHAMPGVAGIVLVVALHALHLAVLLKGRLHVSAPAHHQLRARSD